MDKSHFRIGDRVFYGENYISLKSKPEWQVARDCHAAVDLTYFYDRSEAERFAAETGGEVRGPGNHVPDYDDQIA